VTATPPTTAPTATIATSYVAELGDDPNCDSLAGACGDGDMLARDDLYWSSPVGSGYERIAATCGSRVEMSDIVPGTCFELD
jgi:hypothetical protein